MSSPFVLSVDDDNGCTLSTSFQFAGGRFRHSIEWMRSDGEIVDRWQDEVNSQDEDWPASPPIQQLSLESIHGSPTLLGVGQAGKSHWSISVEAMRIDTKPSLKFDVACRCRELPNWLGSSYQRSLRMVDQVPAIQMIDVSCATNLVQPALIVTCKIEAWAIKKYPATFRWTYLIEVLI